MICLWYHAEREPPTYFPPDIPDIESGNFLFRGRYDTDLAMHIQVRRCGAWLSAFAFWCVSAWPAACVVVVYALSVCASWA